MCDIRKHFSPTATTEDQDKFSFCAISEIKDAPRSVEFHPGEERGG